MNKVIGFFKNAGVIQFLGLISLALLIWFFGPLLAIAGQEPWESVPSRAGTILVMFFLGFLYTLWGRLKAIRANQAMANGLAGSAQAPDKNLLEELSEEEVAVISKTFDEALQTLKNRQSKSRTGKCYLYDLPWYIIIGPPGSGKTTALVNSGLEFPLADKFGKGALRGVGGTRNCDWWFTDEAVLLDTAGRYTTQDSHEAVDKAAWMGFLDLLKTHRPRRPVNGVLITMSLSDLLKQTEGERCLHAQSIRQRIEELHTHLGIRFPVYMIFTKADLVAGFNDFFADLSKEERMQVWGVTFPEENQAAPVDVNLRATRDFDDLLARLNLQLPRRLQDELDLQRRNLIFGFPLRMAMLRESLLAFLQECYGANPYQTQPYLRGIYFTSGTQEGTPIDRLMGMLAKTFKLPRSSAPLFSGKGKSYFITRLLKEVIFAEALLAGLNQRLERTQTLLRQSAYLTALAILILMSGLWFISYSTNQAALAELDMQLQQYDKIVAATPDWQTDFAALLQRMDALSPGTTQAGQALAAGQKSGLGTVYKDAAAWYQTFGFYQGDKLRPVIKDAYELMLSKHFLPLIKTRLEQRLNGLEASNAELFRVYLMMGDPKKMQTGVARLWIAVDWAKTYAQDPETQARLLGHLDNLFKQPLEPQKLNDRLVSTARRVLGGILPAQQVSLGIKSESLLDISKGFKFSAGLASKEGRAFMPAKVSLEHPGIPYFFKVEALHKQIEGKAEETANNHWMAGDAVNARVIDRGLLERGTLSDYLADL